MRVRDTPRARGTRYRPTLRWRRHHRRPGRRSSRRARDMPPDPTTSALVLTLLFDPQKSFDSPTGGSFGFTAGIESRCVRRRAPAGNQEFCHGAGHLYVQWSVVVDLVVGGDFFDPGHLLHLEPHAVRRLGHERADGFERKAASQLDLIASARNASRSRSYSRTSAMSASVNSRGEGACRLGRRCTHRGPSSTGIP